MTRTILFFDADVVMLQLGRWVQLPYYRFLRGKINMPWLTGMFSVLWVSLSVCLISSLLQLRKKSDGRCVRRCLAQPSALRC